MDRGRWQRFVALIQRYGIHPILSVVPDNHDPELVCGSPDPTFWEHMRELQEAGATIGLHGYQHVCTAVGRSLVDLHRRTEFAGAPLDCQREWIRRGLAILRSHRLEPKVWVAPRHGFDHVTLRVLREEGLDVVSDGLAAKPYRRAGLRWIPQQLWGPVARSEGLWTMAYHANSVSDDAVRDLEGFLVRFQGSFTSVDRVLEEWDIGKISLRDRMRQNQSLMRIRLSRVRRRIFS